MMLESKRIAWLCALTLALATVVATANPFRPVPAQENMLASVSRTTHELNTGSDVPVAVAPEPSQVKAARLVTYFLSTYHYRKLPLDDDLSAQILDRYLDGLDPNHSYFTASDVAAFERFRHKLDDNIRNADLAAPFAIFNIYLARLKERVDYALALLEDESAFDFTVDESYQLDRSEAPWPEDQDALDELWRKRVKNDYLSLKLAGKEPEKIRDTLKKRYKSLRDRMTQLDSEDVFQLFMNAYASTIEPHTSYLSPRTSENFQIAMSLSLEGIGAVLERENEYTTIRRIVPGGPADKDGRLKAGDRIVSVGQGEDAPAVDVIGWRLDDVVELIRGPKDSVVRLGVLPADQGLGGPIEEIAITRNKVELEEQSAQKSVIEVGEGENAKRIGIIDVPTFYIDFASRARGDEEFRSTTRDVHKLLDELKAEGVDGVVIDLRGNGGGSLLEATQLTGLFIDTGPVVQVKDASGEVEVERDPDPGVAYAGPLAVLVDRYSASASEIFAAAIQDYGRGIVIGEPTYGKGTVQNLIDLDQFNVGGSESALGQLKITTAQFFRVNGASTQHRGVTPDITWPTAVDRADTGESAYDNALPWSDIGAATYEPVTNLGPVLTKAHSMHRSRIEQNDSFKRLVEDIDEYYGDDGSKPVSLLESERREAFREAEKERQKRLEKSEADQAEEDAESLKDDVLLVEAAHILMDLIRISGDDAPRAAAVDTDKADES